MSTRQDTRWPRIIVHADMDAFYAAVEQRDRPELRGKPVIVGFPGRRSVVTTASYEARPFGVGSAMPMAKAQRLCPNGIVVPPRFERYVEVSAQIMEALGSFSPLVEPLSLDEAFVDMTGATDLFGAPEDMGRRVKARVEEATDGLTVSVGVAPMKYVAKVASDLRKPDGLTVVAAPDVLSFLDPLPVSRLWEIGPKQLPRLLALGLRTIGDVARADAEWLGRQLGSLGDHIHRLATGDDPREVEPGRAQKSVGSEVTLTEDIVGATAIEPHLLRAADEVARRLRADRLVARGVRVKLKTHRFEILTRQAKLRKATSTADDLYGTALPLVGRFDLTVPVRLVGLAAFDLASADSPIAASQGLLFDGGEVSIDEKHDRLDRALDALRLRFGDESIVRGIDLGPPKPRQ